MAYEDGSFPVDDVNDTGGMSRAYLFKRAGRFVELSELRINEPFDETRVRDDIISICSYLVEGRKIAKIFPDMPYPSQGVDVIAVKYDCKSSVNNNESVSDVQYFSGDLEKGIVEHILDINLNSNNLEWRKIA